MKRIFLFCVALLVCVGAFAQGTAPAVDTTSSRRMTDVIGNKADTAATTVNTTQSLAAYAKGIMTKALLIGAPANTGGTATIAAILGDPSNVTFATWLAKIGTVANTGGTATIGAILGDPSNTSFATSLAKLGTIANTGGTATIGGILGDPSNVTFATSLAKLGTLANTGGTATVGGILGDVSNVSVATRLIRNYALLSPTVALGTADIDDSVQDESAAWVVLLTVTPAASSPCRDTRVILDLAKAGTGFGVVEAAATIQFRVARKVDGTNWRGADPLPAAALSGTLAAGRSLEIDVDSIGVTEEARIELLMSADATADMEIPYAVNYGAIAAPTITPVAAG